ncbi:phosphoribosylanthranilate isomerase [Chryseobacterium manosquense]|uniref:N-(5'-phosphoribosyl)anthranilate isomerase n=1 Tax=Chryseobacterium manosquense TaxID=2754694 RepID=A0A7H1DZG0_9FLAO|nr:phosphoribosylanthranilate isomerase [Chryseobacterium manosquense]QNS42368.1 phosphoribosylanthranilate isomerase [Chryseobacterium manosquense]
MKLKVCGLTKLDQIQELISLEVDFLGFIFYEKSPRYVLNHLNLKEISEIPHAGKVGVFVNETIENVIDFSVKANLNFIQLHGDEDDHYIANLKNNLPNQIKMIKVIRIGNQTSEELQKNINQQPSTINYLLFDTDSKAFGGTGKTFDWKILNEVEISIPYFLSGGISLENVHQIPTINTHPFSLDINSKFELEPGMKNLDKIKEFIKSYNVV